MDWYLALRDSEELHPYLLLAPCELTDQPPYPDVADLFDEEVTQ